MKVFIILGCVCCAFSLYKQTLGLINDIKFRKGKKLFRILAEKVVNDYENEIDQ